MSALGRIASQGSGARLNRQQYATFTALRALAKRLRGLRNESGRIDLTDSSKRDEVYNLVLLAEEILK